MYKQLFCPECHSVMIVKIVNGAKTYLCAYHGPEVRYESKVFANLDD